MNKIKTQVFLISIVITAVFMGCSNSSPIPSESEIQTAMAETAAAKPTATLAATTEPSEPPPPPNTPTPETVSPAFVTSTNLNLRTGPSQLFNILDTYRFGDEVFVKGRVPDNKWLQVEATRKDGSGRKSTGWMFAAYLDVRTNLSNIPIIELPAEQTIRGMVKDSNGNPINSIRVTAFYEPSADIQIFSDDTTGADGEFIIYVPENTAGSIDIQIVDVGCNSQIMDDDCVIREYFPTSWRLIDSLPITEPISFTYERAPTYIEGKVVYQDGWGVPNLWVVAERQSDGIEQKIFTEIGGDFLFPLGIGVWEVVAIRTDEDGKNFLSDPEIFTIAADTGALEELRIPVP